MLGIGLAERRATRHARGGNMDCNWKQLGHFCGVVSVLVGCQGDAMRETLGKKEEFWADLDGQCLFIQADATGRFLDATTGIVPSVMTTPYVGDSTQKWCFTLH